MAKKLVHFSYTTLRGGAATPDDFSGSNGTSWPDLIMFHSGKIVYTGTIVFTEIEHWTIVFTALDNCLHKHW